MNVLLYVTYSYRSAVSCPSAVSGAYYEVGCDRFTMSLLTVVPDSSHGAKETERLRSILETFTCILSAFQSLVVYCGVFSPSVGVVFQSLTHCAVSMDTWCK